MAGRSNRKVCELYPVGLRNGFFPGALYAGYRKVVGLSFSRRRAVFDNKIAQLLGDFLWLKIIEWVTTGN